MPDPALALQAAIVTAIKGLGTLIGKRVYDDVPADQNGLITATYPYGTVGPGFQTPIDEECWDRSEFSHQIDIWSDGVGFPEVKQIAGQIRMALHERDIPLAGHVIDRMRVENITYSRTGSINRARITLVTETQPSA